MKISIVLLTVCLMVLATAPLVADTPLEKVVISSNDEYSRSNYPSIARLADGRLLCVYTVGTDSIDGANAVVAAKFSDDHGRSWGKPVILIDSNPELNFDASIIVVGDRVIVSSATVPATHFQFISTSRAVAVRSEDSGRTWTDPYEIPMEQRYVSGMINNGVALDDDTVLFAYSWDVMLEKQDKVGSEGVQDYHCGIMVSEDGGMSWSAGPHLAITASKTVGRTHAINGIDEPAIIELPDKSLYMLCRTGSDKLYESRSYDRGASWTQPSPSSLTSHNAPASLCRIDGDKLGTLVVWCNSPTNRWPLSVAASYDNARTWTEPKAIVEIPGARSAYPGCVQAADGTVVVIWQQEFTDKGPEIHSVRFDVSWLDNKGQSSPHESD
jgi:sialidase-1